MQTLLCVLMLATAPVNDGRADIIYSTDFEQPADLDFDQWPDQWTRLRDEQHPEYLKMRIVADPDPLPESNQALRIDLNGSGAVAYSPPLKISPLFSYRLEGCLKTDQLVHDVAYYTLTFANTEHQPVETYRSQQLHSAPSWRRVVIGPVTPSGKDCKYVVIGAHLEPTAQRDLHGAAMFDRLRLVRLPRMQLHANRNDNLFFDADAVNVTCDVSGIQWTKTQIVFELQDVHGKLLSQSTALLSDFVVDASAAASMRGDVCGSIHQLPDYGGFAGALKWQPVCPGYGVYRIRVAMRQESVSDYSREMTLAVMRENPLAVDTEFGWSLRGADPLSLKSLLPLIQQAGISWVKYPAWYGEEDHQRAEDLAWFADRLGADGIEMVGVLHQPPDDVRSKMGNRKQLSVAEVFLEPEVWQKALDRIMLRLSLKVRWWQLGADDDRSFIGLPDLNARLREIRTYARQFNQDIRLGLPWNWLIELPDTTERSVDFLAMSTSPVFTSAELPPYVTAAAASPVRHWVTLQPLPALAYGVEARSADLVHRMLAAKMAGAKAIFLDDPFAPETGVMTTDGMPTALFATWCVACRMLGGADYLGSMQMPNGSSNHVFACGDEVLMLVWNDKETTEQLYLGQEVTQVDLWGHEMAVPTVEAEQGRKQQLHTTRWPSFVIGLHPAITRWRLHSGFQKGSLRNAFGRTQRPQLHFENTFEKGVRGSFHLVVPESWRMPYRTADFKSATGERFERLLEVRLNVNANSGVQPVRIDFDLMADQRYQFSVFREMRVGTEDIEIQPHTWLDDSGRLVVELQVQNKTGAPISLNCLLFAPQRRRMSRQIFDMEPGSKSTAFVLSRGQELIGKRLWLRAEEIDGLRLLNYTIKAAP